MHAHQLRLFSGAVRAYSGVMSATTRVLVLANRTADSAELLDRLVARHGQAPIVVTMLAPATWEVQDPHGGTESACRRLRAARRYLQAKGIEVYCVAGASDPMVAFEQEWRRGQYDEIIVCTLPSHLSRWLRIDLPRRVAHAAGGVSVTHVVATESSVVAADDGMTTTS
jgi:hypothetical protein